MGLPDGKELDDTVAREVAVGLEEKVPAVTVGACVRDGYVEALTEADWLSDTVGDSDAIADSV